MSFDGDNDFSIIDFEKPFKRVRFSDESDDVYEYEPESEGNNENFSVENETETVSNELQSFEQKEFLPTEESKRKAVDSDNVKDAANSLPEFCDDKVELTTCNKQVTITGDSSEVDCSAQSGENPTDSVVSDSPPIEHFDNNNSQIVDLNKLIYETEHMTITTSEQPEGVNQHMSSSEQVMNTIFLFILTR